MYVRETSVYTETTVWQSLKTSQHVWQTKQEELHKAFEQFGLRITAE